MLIISIICIELENWPRKNELKLWRAINICIDLIHRDNVFYENNYYYKAFCTRLSNDSQKIIPSNEKAIILHHVENKASSIFVYKSKLIVFTRNIYNSLLNNGELLTPTYFKKLTIREMFYKTRGTEQAVHYITVIFLVSELLAGKIKARL